MAFAPIFPKLPAGPRLCQFTALRVALHKNRCREGYKRTGMG